MRRVGRYVLLSRIASGTLGDVFLGRRAGPEEEVAVKLIRPELARDLRFARLLITEAPSAIRFQHPVSVRVFDVDRDSGDLFVASELEHGQPLSAVLKRAQLGQLPLDQQLVCWIGAEIASALEKAHKMPWFQGAPAGMVHGGVSLRSVILTYDGRTKLLGLGMGRARLATQPSIARLPYVAPELLGDERSPLPRSDIYSLGVVLYDALSNRQLFRRATREEMTAAIHEGRIPPLAPSLLRVEPMVADLVEGMMAPRPDSRPEDLGEAERVLRAAAGKPNEECRDLLGQKMRTIFAGEIQAERRVVAAALRKRTSSTLDSSVPDEAKTDDSSSSKAPAADPFNAALSAMIDTFKAEGASDSPWSQEGNGTARSSQDVERVATLTDAPVEGQPPVRVPATDKDVTEPKPNVLETTTIDLGAKRRIARYQTEGLIHRSASAVFVRAHDPNVGRDVVLKMMDPDFVSDPRLRRDDWISLFKREARIAGRLNHASIPQLHDAGRDGSTFFIAYALIAGKRLSEILSGPEKISTEAIRRIVVDVAAALDHIHGRGLVHADVRAANVLVDANGLTYLADLSMAHEQSGAEHPLLATNLLAASPEYLAGFGYGPRSDQFALGMLLYQLLTGARPFTALEDRKLAIEIQTKSPRPPESLDPGVDKGLSEAAMRMLEKDPMLRFESLRALIERFGSRVSVWGTAGEGLGASRPEPRGQSASESDTEPQLMRKVGVEIPVSKASLETGAPDIAIIDSGLPPGAAEMLTEGGARVAIFSDAKSALAAIERHAPRLVVAARSSAGDPRLLRRDLERISAAIELRLVPDAVARILGPVLSTEELVLSLISVYQRTAALSPDPEGMELAEAARSIARRLGAGPRAEMLAPLAAAARDLALRLRVSPTSEAIAALVPGEVVALFQLVDRVLTDPEDGQAASMPLIAQIVAAVEWYFTATRPRDDRPRASPRKAVLDLRAQAGKRLKSEVIEALVEHLREVISALDLADAEPNDAGVG